VSGRVIVVLLLMTGVAAAEGEPGRVTLAPEVVAAAGIATVRVERVTATPDVEAFGRVLDPLPLVEALHARAAARSAAAAAAAEYERVERLHRQDQNASTRDVETARVALDRARMDLADASARAALAWGSGLDAADALADDLVSGRAAIARIDLPAGEHVVSPPVTVNLAPITHPDQLVSARVLGPAPTTDPQLQGDAYLALVAEGRPAVGTALRAAVPRQAEPLTGVGVPRAAILWSEGHAIVYVEASPGVFERRAVTLVAPLAGGSLVSDGVAAGDRVVTSGAAQLLSSAVLGVQPAD
jgi:hypothetical protein